jgi:hypothetical protein
VASCLQEWGNNLHLFPAHHHRYSTYAAITPIDAERKRKIVILFTGGTPLPFPNPNQRENENLTNSATIKLYS